MKIIIGLGNPGKEYEGSRHNTGRSAAMVFADKNDLGDFLFDKKSNSLVVGGKVGKESVTIALPETFMNKSGSTAAKIARANPDVKSGPRLHNKNSKIVRRGKEMPDLIVLHDDLDIPLGKFKISYGKNSGGHKGVESVMRTLKTKNFVRIRIGVSPKHKPGQKEVMKFIIGKFKPAEQEVIKKVYKKIAETLEIICTDSLERARSEIAK